MCCCTRWSRLAERGNRAAYLELNGGPQQLVLLGSKVGRRWNRRNADAHQVVRDLVRVRAQSRLPLRLRRGGGCAETSGGPVRLMPRKNYVYHTVYCIYI